MGMHIRKGGKFMKLKKKSGLMGAVIALSAASLVSVGFASWVISQGDEEVINGNIIVDTVTTEKHEITVTPASGTSINFTKPQSVDPAPAYNWLDETTTTYEALSASFTVSVDKINDASAAAAKAKFTAVLETGKMVGDEWVPDTASTGYLAAATAKYVIELPDASVEVGTLESKVWTTTVSFELDWGDHFDGDNPYIYYNAHKSTDKIEGATPEITYGADAEASLAELHTLLNGVQYRLTLTFAE